MPVSDDSVGLERSEAGAPEHEIEITAEMIGAGIKAIEIWDSGDLPEWKVVSVYKAMERARKGAMVTRMESPAFPAEAKKVR
jgi:hypothetical protein